MGTLKCSTSAAGRAIGVRGETGPRLRRETTEQYRTLARPNRTVTLGWLKGRRGRPRREASALARTGTALSEAGLLLSLLAGEGVQKSIVRQRRVVRVARVATRVSAAPRGSAATTEAVVAGRRRPAEYECVLANVYSRMCRVESGSRRQRVCAEDAEDVRSTHLSGSDAAETCCTS